MLPPPPEKLLSRNLLDVLIRAGLILLLALFCFRIFHPFLDLMLWSVILGITLYPLHQLLSRVLGERPNSAATLIVLIGLVLLLVPVVVLGLSIADSVRDVVQGIQNRTLRIPLPPDSVATWPVVGQYIHAFWSRVATDFMGVVHQVAPHLQGFAKGLLAQAAGVGMSLMQFLAAFVIAGVIMAYGRQGTTTAQDIAIRISGPERGPGLAQLCTATIRTVAQGVVGVAFIQMLILGIGFIVMGIPGAGLLALGVLLLGITQLPVVLITIPAIVYVFATNDSLPVSILFTVWTVAGGLSDNVLKPLMFGRGVKVPMPVILIGALGGMLSNGIIGLFVGPVVLALGYELFMSWVRERETLAEPPVTPSS
ncbi:permease [Pseudomonas sp. ATCC 13867]|uniref:AI-2E family transporter n=1 Tax=Pseudomonas sp. ATCC 13867 TaxID=1294143 RepID=UPI0002C4E6A1|nr:AI-2E family transporter [Pseudomonas sp. ATCC 13867]AGI23718.1 permease [Pseudomonas sp. ATCC 13867]RFQ38327.1 AI-2E family transporter [Pseudomonas sp. ATCC 13867]